MKLPAFQPPDVVCDGRCGACARKHPHRKPTFVVNVNLGPGDKVGIHWMKRSNGRLTVLPDPPTGTVRHTCHQCGHVFTVRRTRLLELARAAAGAAVDGRCSFTLE